MPIGQLVLVVQVSPEEELDDELDEELLEDELDEELLEDDVLGMQKGVPLKIFTKVVKLSS